MQKIIIALAAATMLAGPAQAEERDRDWSLALTGGTTTLSGSGDQPFASIGLTRFFGASYVRLTGSYIDSDEDEALLSTVPASTRQLTLAAGTVTGALGIDGYLSVGDRDFDTRSFTVRTGRTVTLDSNGSSFGAGLSLTYEVPLGDNGVLAPFIAGDYSQIDIARAVTLPNGDSFAEEASEDGVTGSAGATAAWLFGPDQRHSAGLYGAFLASSNNSAFNGTNALRATALGLGNGPGVSDEWFEYGASASFGLSDAVGLDLGIVRTAGFLGPEATSFTVGLRFGF